MGINEGWDTHHSRITVRHFIWSTVQWPEWDLERVRELSAKALSHWWLPDDASSDFDYNPVD